MELVWLGVGDTDVFCDSFDTIKNEVVKLMAIEETKDLVKSSREGKYRKESSEWTQMLMQHMNKMNCLCFRLFVQLLPYISLHN